MDDQRVEAFRRLKPACVEVSQQTLRYKSGETSSKNLIGSLEQLLVILDDENLFLDAKLADYAFFPLSHVFRDAKDFPARALEVALTCLRILILRGWQSHLSTEVSKQLVIMLSFLAGGKPTSSSVQNVKEEVSIASFQNLAGIAQVTKNLGLGSHASVDTANFPALGHAVTVMIDGFADGPSLKVKLAALSAVQQTLKSITEQDALRSIFPGIVSSLSKTLAGKGSQRPHIKVLVRCIDILRYILQRVLAQIDEGSGTEQSSKDPWIDATSHQVKLALANILPLINQDQQDVQQVLIKLCSTLLKSCQASLPQSMPMLLEALTALTARSGDDHETRSDLIVILQQSSNLQDILRTSLYDWSISLPRTLQSHDTTKAQRLVGLVSTALSVLDEIGASTEVLLSTLSTNLQASVVSAIQNTSKEMIKSSPEVATDVSHSLQLAHKTSQLATFPPILFRDAGRRNSLSSLETLVGQFRDTVGSEMLERDILRTLTATTGNEQLASLWLSLQLLSRNVGEDSFMNEFLDSRALQPATSSLLDETYGLSLSILSRSTFESEKTTWALQALSLEAVALQARFQGKEFRPELVDALYPILERLGSGNAVLQQHAMACINLVARACGYIDSAALVIDNADYLVNALSLKLNTFEISPQAPQVMVMMIKLCGAPIVPFMDDLVESVFSVLACYHGYPRLVESLFSVLDAIVEETSKGGVPLIEDSKDTTTRPKPYKPMTMNDLNEWLVARRQKREEQANAPLYRSPPRSPEPEKAPSSSQENEREDNEATDLDTLPAAEPPAAKPSKANTIITSITNLVPSHLSSPSPSLRVSLLNLLSTSFPQLSRDTDLFLPIAAKLYSYIATRLYSPATPSFEVAAAARTTAVLCHCAGDFMRSRVDEDWQRMTKLYERLEGEMVEEVRVQRGRTGGMKWRAWDAMVGLVCGILKDVGFNEEEGGEDWLFEILGVYLGGVERRAEIGQKDTYGKKRTEKDRQALSSALPKERLISGERREELKETLQGQNPDYLWFVQEQGRVQRGGEPLKTPADVDGTAFRPFTYIS